jgi:hypothetical protein
MMTQELISIFESSFRRLYFENSTEAAAYYSLLVKDFPSTLKSMALNSKSSYLRLVRGRSELLKRGYIAKIIDLDEEIKSEFKNRELYLPVNPALIWEELEIEQLRAFDEDEMKLKSQKIANFESDFQANFGKFGVGIAEGNISVHYGGLWFFYTLINNLKEDHRLKLMIGRLGSFRTPYIEFYKKMFEKYSGNVHLQMIYNFPRSGMPGENENSSERLKNLDDLSANYPGKILYIPSKVPHATSRRIIFEHSDGKPYMAIDARKILPLTRVDPSYTGTIYFQDDALRELKYNFEEAWKNTDATAGCS